MPRRGPSKPAKTAPFNNPPYVLMDRTEAESIGLYSGNTWPHDFLKNISKTICHEPALSVTVRNWDILFAGTGNESCWIRIGTLTPTGCKITRVNLRKGLSIMCLCSLDNVDSSTTFTSESGNLLTTVKGDHGKMLAEVNRENADYYKRYPGELKWDIMCMAYHSVTNLGLEYKLWWVTISMCTQHQLNLRLHRSCRVCRASTPCTC